MILDLRKLGNTMDQRLPMDATMYQSNQKIFLTDLNAIWI